MTKKKAADDLGADEVQEQVDAEEEKGYRGEVPDPTPNANYSLQTPPDAPTPETDPELAAQSRAALNGLKPEGGKK